MALKERAEVSIGGPDGQSTWGDEGDSFTLQNHATISVTTTTPGAFPAQTITTPNLTLSGGQSNPDWLPPGSPIQTWSGVQIANGSTAMAAASNLNFYFMIYRNLGLGVALASGVAITQITVAAPLVAPLANSQTIVIENPSGNTQSVTTSAAVAAGQTVIPIGSVTPSHLYPVGSPGVMNGSTAICQVGNSGAFGWTVAGGGTPVFPANSVVLTPAISGNIALANGMLTLCESDCLQVYLITGSSTFTMQVVNCQPLIV